MSNRKASFPSGKLILPVLLVVAIIIFWFIFRDSSPQQMSDPVIPYVQQNGHVYIPEVSPIRDRLEIAVASKEPVRRTVQAPASVEANPAKRANIFPPAGGRIVQLLVNMGESVRVNQPLFEIYSPDIAEIQAEYNSARSSMAQAERTLRRAEDLHEKGIISRRELEEAQTDYEIVRSEMDGMAMKLRIFGMTEDDLGKPLMVRSPINGRVVDLQVAAGEYIAEPEEPLMIVADLTSVWVTASIQEKDIRFVHPGSDVRARFSAYPGEVYEGTVLFISDILDQETRSTRVRIAFDNPDRKLKPGMFASVTFLTDREPAITLPSTAVLQRRDFNFVYVQTEPYTFEMRQVTTAETVGDKVIIQSGIDEGEEILVRNAVLLP